MTTEHTFPPLSHDPLNDAGIKLAQSIEQACTKDGIRFEGIWCSCSDCQHRMALVRSSVPTAANDSIETLQRVCFIYWRTFRRKAALA
jgi:hypothetical protein